MGVTSCRKLAGVLRGSGPSETRGLRVGRPSFNQCGRGKWALPDTGKRRVRRQQNGGLWGEGTGGVGGSRHRQGQKSSCPPEDAPPLSSRVPASQAFQAPVLQAFGTLKVSPGSSFKPSLSGAPRGWGHSPQGAPARLSRCSGPRAQNSQSPTSSSSRLATRLKMPLWS